MGKRGGVRRMDSRSRERLRRARWTTAPLLSAGTEDRTIWSASQNLIGQELEDELSTVEERWRHWSKARLVDAGLTLYDLKARPRGRLFGDPILVFEARDGGRLPVHRFTATWSSLAERGHGARKPWKAWSSAADRPECGSS